MSDQAPLHASAAPQIIDVEFGISTFRVRPVVLAALLGVLPVLALVLLIASVASYLPSNPALAGIILAAPLGALVWVAARQFRRLTRARVSQLLDTWERDGLCSNATEENPCRGITTQTGLVELGRSLVGRGRLGFVIRSVPYPDRRQPEPLTMPFQPVPLNHRDPRFADAESQGNGRRGGWRQLWRSWRHRKSMLLLRLFLCVGGIHFCWVFVSEALRTLYDGHVSFKLATALVVLGSLVVSFIMIPTWRGSRWLLVPGGLVRRLPGKKFSSRLHVFEPASSLLIITTQVDQWWHAYIWDETTYGSIQMNRSEAELLLRNWLSKMPPPKAEDLSDLA